MQRVEDVVRQTGQQVDKEPTLQVVDPHRTQVQYDVTGSGDEGRVTVEEDVDKEDDVDDAVGSQLGNVVDRLALERGVVRHHDGRVISEHEDQPVPGAAEPRVVKDDVLRSAWRRRTILCYRRI